jgi:hypothetical protein
MSKYPKIINAKVIRNREQVHVIFGCKDQYHAMQLVDAINKQMEGRCSVHEDDGLINPQPHTA